MLWPFIHYVRAPVKLHSKSNQFGHLLQKLNVLLVCLTDMYHVLCNAFTPSSFPDKSRLKKLTEKKKTGYSCKISCVTSKSKALFSALQLAN